MYKSPGRYITQNYEILNNFASHQEKFCLI